jgi:heme-degrading monooxygenase HmoA
METVEDTTVSKARIVFMIKLKPGRSDDFLRAYEQIRHLVAEGVSGHLGDQVCQATGDDDSWVITSEWETLEHFLAWEATEEHRALIKPMRDCFAEARSLRYLVRRETTGRHRHDTV